MSTKSKASFSHWYTIALSMDCHALLVHMCSLSTVPQNQCTILSQLLPSGTITAQATYSGFSVGLKFCGDNDFCMALIIIQGSNFCTGFRYCKTLTLYTPLATLPYTYAKADLCSQHVPLEVTAIAIESNRKAQWNLTALYWCTLSTIKALVT